MDKKNDSIDATTPLLKGESGSVGPSSPVLPQYQENLLEEVPPIPESDKGSTRSQEQQREDIYAASPGQGQPVVDTQQSAKKWHRNILQRAQNGRSDGAQPSRANAVPLSLLGRWEAVVECPVCKELTRTTLKHKAGRGTHTMATILFFTTGVGVFVPYVTDFAKNARHNCLKCGSSLATNHFGSGTEAHLI